MTLPISLNEDVESYWEAIRPHLSRSAQLKRAKEEFFREKFPSGYHIPKIKFYNDLKNYIKVKVPGHERGY
jgi:hypothetical protein